MLKYMYAIFVKHMVNLIPGIRCHYEFVICDCYEIVLELILCPVMSRSRVNAQESGCKFKLYSISPLNSLGVRFGRRRSHFISSLGVVCFKKRRNFCP